MAKIVTLKDNNDGIVYPITPVDGVFVDSNTTLADALDDKAEADLSNVATGAITGTKIASNTISSSNIDWSTLDGSELGWKYLGQEKITAAASSITFTFPAQYNCYKIIFGGQMASTTSANSWLDFIWQNGTTSLTTNWQRIEFTGASAPSSVWNTNVTYAINAGAAGVHPYDGINIEVYSVKTTSTQWRKYQGTYSRNGDGATTILANGRFASANEPTRIKIQTGGSFEIGATIKVWGCNV